MKVKLKKLKKPALAVDEQPFSMEKCKWFHHMSDEEKQKMLTSRNRKVKFEYIEHIFKVVFYSAITLLFIVLFFFLDYYVAITLTSSYHSCLLSFEDYPIKN